MNPRYIPLHPHVAVSIPSSPEPSFSAMSLMLNLLGAIDSALAEQGSPFRAADAPPRG